MRIPHLIAIAVAIGLAATLFGVAEAWFRGRAPSAERLLQLFVLGTGFGTLPLWMSVYSRPRRN